MVVYATLIFCTREVEPMLMFAGQMGCEALNYILKRVFKEARPARVGGLSGEEMRALGKGYGMPSSHAQFMGYFAVYGSLFLLVRYGPTRLSGAPSAAGDSRKAAMKVQFPDNIIPPKAQGVVLSAAFIAIAALVAESRIYLHYHTPKQVIVGVCAGATCAALWFVATGMARGVGLVDWLLDLNVLRAVRVRDLVVDEDIWESGWREWEGRRAARRGKGVGGGKKRR
jgi:dolichyldiphosphatase